MIELDHIKPCEKCGERCQSQLDFMESNGGKPWPTCSGCGLDEDGEPRPTKKSRPLPKLWALYDSTGELFDVYTSKDEADTDAVGPRFWDGYTVRSYRMLLRREEPNDRSARK
jgi:hypothetical protein